MATILTYISLLIALWIPTGLISDSESANLLFAGDAMCHKAQLETAHKGGNYSFDGYYNSIKPAVLSADYAVVNLETPVYSGSHYSGYPCFNAPDSFVQELKKCGFDLLLTANNHTLDRRVTGGRKTIALLDSLKIDHIGTYSDIKARNFSIPFIKNIKGFRIGFLNYTYGTNGFKTSDGFIVDYIDKEKIAEDISRTRLAGAELIAVAIHWGTEYRLLPDNSEKDLAEFLRHQGVDMIIGGHPHVVQPMNLSDGQFTVFSLGNLISNMKTVDCRGGAIVRVTIKRDNLGKAYVDDAAYSLVVVEPPTKKGDNFKLIPVEKASEYPSREYARNFLASTGKSLERNNKNVKRVPVDSLIPVPVIPEFTLPHFNFVLNEQN